MLGQWLKKRGGGGTGSGSNPMAIFGISGLTYPSLVATELVKQFAQ
jgi:hypothetical protein